MPLPAFAAIQGTDQVGNSTVSDRGLTITEAPTVECARGVLCDKDGTVLWSRDADERCAMASTTKMMTAIVALENGDMDAKYTISQAAASVGESSMELTAGVEVSLHDLLCGLLVKSGNDAGVAIAEGIAGSEDKFATMMNEKAVAMGLQNTHFTNPHGLDAQGHYASAYDLSVIARYGMQNETFREIVGTKKVKIKLGKLNYTFKSTNSLLNTWDECIGIKTGFTGEAGYCLTSAATRGGVELYAVVLGCENEAERFTDSYRLLDWGFKHYRSVRLANADDVLAEVPLSGFVNKTVKAGVASDVDSMALDYDGDISVDIKTSDLPDGVDEGDTVGAITWRQGEKVVASAPLVAKERAGKPLALVSVWTSLCRFVGVPFGKDFIAQGVLHAQPVTVTRKDDLSGEDVSADVEQAIKTDIAN